MAQQGTRLLIAESRRRRLMQPVRPTASCLGEPLFQNCGVNRRDCTARRTNDEVDARQRGLVELSVKGRDLPGKCLFEDCPEAAAQFAVVALARHIDKAGNVALQRVAADKYGDALPLLQVEDAGYGVEQLVLIGLEQFVTWKRVEDVQQSLAVVARRRRSGALDDPANLEPQQRYRAGTAAVGQGCKKAEEEANAGDVAVCTEPPHSDGIHVSGPVNRSTAVRFGDDQQFATADEILHVGR